MTVEEAMQVLDRLVLDSNVPMTPELEALTVLAHEVDELKQCKTARIFQHQTVASHVVVVAQDVPTAEKLIRYWLNKHGLEDDAMRIESVALQIPMVVSGAVMG